MGRRLLSLLIALPLALAGCIAAATGDAPATTPSGDAGALALSASAAPLWDDPQNAPHPAWGWPTLTHPATGDVVPPLWSPIPSTPTPDQIARLQRVATLDGKVFTGAGIAIFGSLVVVPGYRDPSAVVDISDPASPQVLSEFGGGHRGAAIIAYPDGRLVAVLARAVDVEVWDLTDPTAPAPLPSLASRSHKVGVVPGTPIVYNAPSAGALTQIYDLTDPERPVLVQSWRNGHGCHHVYFWITADKQRAVCAGRAVTQLWDIADPRAPTVVSEIPAHHGEPSLPPVGVSPVTFSHFSILNRDGDVLVVGDEMGGGLLAACGAHASAGGLAASTPTGALWFYDVSDERAPRLLGWFSPSAHWASNPWSSTACTAHHGRLVPTDDGRDILAMAWYGAGVVVLDFTDPANAKRLAQWNARANTWEAWYYNGYVFTGDLNHGLDVLTFA